jgi:hypothetical protein
MNQQSKLPSLSNPPNETSLDSWDEATLAEVSRSLSTGLKPNMRYRYRGRKERHTPEQIAQELRIDEDGRLWWRRPKVGAPRAMDRPIGTLNNGYLQTQLDHKTYKVHRIAFCLYYGRWPDGLVDHIDGNRTNNRKDNLREASDSENKLNQISLYCTNTSGHTGVYWCPDRGKWKAQAQVDNVTRYGGQFDTYEEAVEARKKLEVLYGITNQANETTHTDITL